MATLKRAPIALIIMDGWGIGDDADKSNAVKVAPTPNIDRLWAENPHTQLRCSGEAVGLPDGQMGNSEVGHTNIGAGRIVYQELTRITKAIRDESFFDNETFNDAIAKIKKDGGALHLFGLVSPGGVHSHTDHLYALLELAKRKEVSQVYVHAFLDGRDVPPKSAMEYIADLEKKISEIGIGSIATVSGRYYAMDRDKRWERIEQAYEAIAHAKGQAALSAASAVENSYKNDVTDEFVLPTVISGYNGMKPADGVIFFNFRPDRARELTHVFTDDKFTAFKRDDNLRPVYVTMTQYEAGLNVSVAYKPQELTNTLGEVIEKAGLTQLRIAETEKYAHVTFFLNGGAETPYKAEDRILVPSPKVATYDLKPEMSAVEVTDKVVEAIESEKYDFIILNYANGDMVGHTGVQAAAEKAVTTVDTCVGFFVEAIKRENGIVCITADHGNAEMMLDKETGEPFTAHTTNPVPFIVVNSDVKSLHGGALCDIAPTLLELAGIEVPVEMTGKSLIDK